MKIDEKINIKEKSDVPADASLPQYMGFSESECSMKKKQVSIMLH